MRTERPAASAAVAASIQVTRAVLHGSVLAGRRARELRPCALVAVSAIIGACAVVAGCAGTGAASPQALVLRGEGLGSDWTVKLAGAPPGERAEIQRGIQASIESVSRSLSRWDETSEMSALNASAEALTALAPVARAPSAQARGGLAPSADARSADAPSVGALSADAPSGDALSAHALSAHALSADARSGDARSGDAPSGDAPSAYAASIPAAAAVGVRALSDWQPVSRGLFEALRYAFTLAADTGGAFDPTVTPLVDAWGFGKAGRRYEPPSPEALNEARSRVGFKKVALDASGLRVRKPAGIQIDLSSMQHGRGADAVSEYLESLGITSYLVDVGSEIRARGESPGGGAWRVAIERPPLQEATATNDFEHVVFLRDASIATSGNFRYYFDYNGRRYSHRIDPRTGEPVSHALVSVTVIAPICMHADALATALTVLGPDEGFDYATRRGIAALFVSRSGDQLVEKMTPRFATYLN